MRVVIADDEPIILKGLKVLIEWAQKDMEIVGEALDGRQLWDLVLALDPEIVISDISMPNMTGLDFMRKLKEENRSTKVIFISGYQKFSYVQEAIGLGAVDYLLKPVQKNALEEALAKAVNSLDEKKTLDFLKADKNELQQLFQQLNEGKEFAKEELYDSFQKMGIDYNGKRFCGICLFFTKDYKKEIEQKMYEKMDLMRFSTFNAVQDFFKEKKNGFVIKRETDCLSILCVVTPKETETFFQDVIWQMKEKVESDLHVKLQIGIGDYVDHVLELPYAYKSAKLAFDMKYFLEKEIIDLKTVKKKYNLSFEDYNEMRDKVKEEFINQEEGCLADLEKCIDMAANIHFGNRYAVVNRIILLAGELFKGLQEYNLVEEEDWQEEELYMERIRQQESLADLKKVAMEHYQCLWKQVAEQAKDSSNPAIAQVKKYMEEHYAENITTKQLAKMACVNSYYFSALFKKVTGQNYKAYLTDIRMKAAKRMLLANDLKVYEIAEKTGYNNVHQFTNKFKEYYGSNPNDYKKQILERKE